MPAHPQNELLKAWLIKNVKECDRLQYIADMATGPTRVLALMETANAWRTLYTGWWHWLESEAQKYRNAGKMNELFSMELANPSEHGWGVYCSILKELRDECAKRNLESHALSAAIGGISDCTNGMLELSAKDSDGTIAERFASARTMLQGYMPNGMLPKDGTDDVFAKLKVVCEKEIADKQTGLDNGVPQGDSTAQMGATTPAPKESTGPAPSDAESSQVSATVVKLNAAKRLVDAIDAVEKLEQDYFNATMWSGSLAPITRVDVSVARNPSHAESKAGTLLIEAIEAGMFAGPEYSALRHDVRNASVPNETPPHGGPPRYTDGNPGAWRNMWVLQHAARWFVEQGTNELPDFPNETEAARYRINLIADAIEGWSKKSRSTETSPAADAPPIAAFIFRRDNGTMWKVRFGSDDAEGTYEHLRGFEIIAKLLASPNPDVPFKASEFRDSRQIVDNTRLEMSGIVSAEEVSSIGQANDEVIDDEGLRRFEVRLEQIKEDRERTQNLGDEEKITQLDNEAANIEQELKAIRKSGNRDHSLNDNNLERIAEDAIRKALKTTYKALKEHHSSLVKHLKSYIMKVDYTYAYRPPNVVEWKL